MHDFSLPTFLSSLAGSGVTAWLVVKGLSGPVADRWLARYKSGLDKEFENYRDALEQKRKQIEAELGHRTYVTKTQFDTEFNANEGHLCALGRLRLSFNGLRPFYRLDASRRRRKAKGTLCAVKSLSESDTTCLLMPLKVSTRLFLRTSMPN
jgi:hypothetical protein